MKDNRNLPLQNNLGTAGAAQSFQETEPQLPPGMAVLAAGRDHLRTTEFAALMGITAQTARKNYCKRGSCYDIRPIKLPNRRLMWPVSATAALLRSAESGAAPTFDHQQPDTGLVAP